MRKDFTDVKINWIVIKYSEEEKNWVLRQIKSENSYKSDPRRHKVVTSGISPKELENRAIEGRTPHGNAAGIPSRDKVRQIIKDLRAEGRIDYRQSGGRKRSLLVELKLDQRMQNDRTSLYAAYIRLLADIDRMVKRAPINAYSAKDFFEYVKIKNELNSFPLQVYYSGLTASDRVKSELANDLQENVKKKIFELKKAEKFQKNHYWNFDKIIQAIEQLSKFQYELYSLFNQCENGKRRKQIEGLIRSQRNEVELLIKEGKTNHAS